MATKIILEDGSELHLAKDVSFPVNMKVTDIRDFTKRTGSYSNTVEIAGTKNNIKVLSFLFDVNTYDATFNIRKKIKCQIIQDGVQVFTKLAYFQLKKVEKSSQSHSTDNDSIKFYGLVFNTVANFSNIIKKRLVEDLSISTPSDIHTLNQTNIVNSFAHDVSDKYVYPVYYKAPYLYNGALSGVSTYNISDFKPAIFMKTIWDAIHSEAGFSYEWTNLTANAYRFDKLITTYNQKYEASKAETLKHSIDIGTELNPDPDVSSPPVENAGTITFHSFSAMDADNDLLYLNNGSFSVRSQPQPHQTVTIGTYPFITNNVASFMKTISNVNRDDLSQYDNTTGEMTPVLQGEYQVEFTIDYDMILNLPEASDLDVQQNDNFLGIVMRPYVRIQPTQISQQGSWERYENAGEAMYVELEDNYGFSAGDNIIKSATYKGMATIDINPDDGEKIDTFGVSFEVVQNPTYSNQNNNNVNIAIQSIATNDSINATPKIDISSINIKITPQINYQQGLTIDIDNFLPKGWKQSEFIKDVMTMYNLLPVPDEDDENKIIYKSRDEFYDSGSDYDFSQDVDESKKKEVEFLPNLKNKFLEIGYSDGEDEINKLYKKATGQTYGNMTVKYDSEYTEGTEERKITPAPTPVRPMKAFGGYAPVIDVEEPESTPRILYWIGEVDNDWVSIRERDGTVTQPGSYGLAHHSDNPVQPGFDINFSVCRYYFYPEYTPTVNNLFNLHYRRLVNQINEGKLMRLWLNLDPHRVSKLRLNDKIYIDNSWWNINELKYDANKANVVKVELISVDDSAAIKPYREVGRLSDINNWGFGGGFGDNTGGAQDQNYSQVSKEIETGLRKMNTGSGNRYGGNNDGADVRGSDNTLQASVRNSFILGNRNQSRRSGQMIVGDEIATDLEGLSANNLNVYGRINFPNKINGKLFDVRYYEVNLAKEEIRNLSTTPYEIDTDDLGHDADSGAYLILVEAVVDNGGTKWTGNRPITIDGVTIIDDLEKTRNYVTDSFNNANHVTNGNTISIKSGSTDPTDGGDDQFIKFRIYYRILRGDQEITSS